MDVSSSTLALDGSDAMVDAVMDVCVCVVGWMDGWMGARPRGQR